jgi:hypothetical protein
MAEQMTPPQMTLRDWFAGQALSSMASNSSNLNPKDQRAVEMANKFAEYAFIIADAMMKRRGG